MASLPSRWKVPLPKTPRITAILPVRLLPSAKKRLEGLLDDSARHRLVLAMLKDALTAATEAREIQHVMMVTNDEKLKAPRRSQRVETFIANSGSLNGDLATAIEHARNQGADAVLIVLPDLPLLTATTLDALIQAGRGETAVVIAKDWRGTGTNALYLRPPAALHPQFGSNSFDAHLAQAKRAGLNPVSFVANETALDLDDAEALTRFQQVATGLPKARTTNTYRTLSKLLDLKNEHSYLAA